MEATIQVVVDVPDQNELQTLSDRLSALAREFSSGTVSTSSAFTEQPYTVAGSIRGTPDARWAEVIKAPDKAIAELRAIEIDPDRTVTVVLVAVSLVAHLFVERPGVKLGGKLRAKREHAGRRARETRGTPVPL